MLLQRSGRDASTTRTPDEHDVLLVLKFLGFEQHVAQVAERGNGERQQSEHHGTGVEKGVKLDVVKEVNRAVEKPEAG